MLIWKLLKNVLNRESNKGGEETSPGKQDSGEMKSQDGE